jgi:hypothetical protein
MEPGSISVIGDVIRVDKWQFEDKITSELLKERPIEEWNELFGRFIKIGALAAMEGKFVGGTRAGVD